MKPERESLRLLGVTRSKAKMYEYSVPESHHIKIEQHPAKLFSISISLLGDLAAAINRDEPNLQELKDTLLFSARFFDSYLQSKLNGTLDHYLLLLGSASYYLCDRPGNASVLVKKITTNRPNLGGDGLEGLLCWLLKGNLESYHNDYEGRFSELTDKISKQIIQFFKGEVDKDKILDLAVKLKTDVYEFGTPRQLLFGDIIAAILKKKIENSTWESLPRYSNLSRDKWIRALQKESFIKELWPAQHFLGKNGVFKGKSAVVQMPTSAGKTKATEIILRSAFLADRNVSLAIIIAPFRALCHEIRDNLISAFDGESIKIDELSDVLQYDFDLPDFPGHKQILVVTPEKLLYILRHDPNLAIFIGLLIFDEGHQFDNGARGITYELLLTSLRSKILEGVQKVLISAVINNAEKIGEWLNDNTNVVRMNLIPTFKSIGFISWRDYLGRIEYVDDQNVEENSFFVPRVIEKLTLKNRGRETKERFFPEKSDGKTIALYIGLKLVSMGSVAIFCGRKDTATNLCEKAVDIFERKASLDQPSKFSNPKEIERLLYLHTENLGRDVSESKSARCGIFSHHGNTPHGIRLAVEHAMREELVRFVVCTSTLAQGVNLPIRYLVIPSVYQAGKRIKIRDFHNLVGRAGRAGMHTEGSILFADPRVYDGRRSRKERWRWKQVKKLLEPDNSEPCISNLLSIFDPIESDDGKYMIKMEALDFTREYIDNHEKFGEKIIEFADQNEDKGFTRNGVRKQIIWRINLICAIESFLLSNWDESGRNLSEIDVINLAEGTLAFFLADEQKKEHIRQLFQLIADNISKSLPDAARRKIFSRTMYGILDSQSIEKWVMENTNDLLATNDETEVIDLFWPLLTKHVKNKIFTKIDPPEVIQKIAYAWIAGNSFADLSKIIQENGAIRKTTKMEFEIKTYDIVEICEEAFAYEGGLLVGALCEFVEALDQKGVSETLNRLQFFQKRLKYGLKTRTSISLYEVGFSDRVIAQGIAERIAGDSLDRDGIVTAIQENEDSIREYITKFPSYFINLFERIVNP